jgi:hypothetical protein
MTCNKDDAPGYTCGGSGHALGSVFCVEDDHYEGCGQHFGSLAAFDAHRMGKRCAEPQEMVAMGYILSDHKVWRSPMDEETAARLRGTRHPSTIASHDEFMDMLRG